MWSLIDGGSGAVLGVMEAGLVKFFSRGNPLTPVERAVLAATAERLAPEAAMILARQVALLRSAHRQPPAGREVLLYPRRPGQWKDADTFPDRAQERRLAQVRFRCPRVEGEWRARLTLVRGHLFTIVYDRSPRPLRRSKGIEVTDVKILHDPMVPVPDPSKQPRAHEEPRLSERLRVWLHQHQAHGIAGPMGEEGRRGIETELLAGLPSDYGDLLQQCDGFIVGAVALHGLNDVHEVHLETGDYIHIGACPSGAILVPADGGSDRDYYYCAFDGTAPQSLGASLLPAIERVLAQPDGQRPM